MLDRKAFGPLINRQEGDGIQLLLVQIILLVMNYWFKAAEKDYASKTTLRQRCTGFFLLSF